MGLYWRGKCAIPPKLGWILNRQCGHFASEPICDQITSQGQHWFCVFFLFFLRASPAPSVDWCRRKGNVSEHVGVHGSHSKPSFGWYSAMCPAVCAETLPWLPSHLPLSISISLPRTAAAGWAPGESFAQQVKCKCCKQIPTRPAWWWNSSALDCVQ